MQKIEKEMIIKGEMNQFDNQRQVMVAETIDRLQ